jgi:hypothetical protein
MRMLKTLQFSYVTVLFYFVNVCLSAVFSKTALVFAVPSNFSSTLVSSCTSMRAAVIRVLWTKKYPTQSKRKSTDRYQLKWINCENFCVSRAFQRRFWLSTRHFTSSEVTWLIYSIRIEGESGSQSTSWGGLANPDSVRIQSRFGPSVNTAVAP